MHHLDASFILKRTQALISCLITYIHNTKKKWCPYWVINWFHDNLLPFPTSWQDGKPCESRTRVILTPRVKKRFPFNQLILILSFFMLVPILVPRFHQYHSSIAGCINQKKHTSMIRSFEEYALGKLRFLPLFTFSTPVACKSRRHFGFCFTKAEIGSCPAGYNSG